VYFAGNVVWRSPDFGLTWERISPDLTRNDSTRHGPAGGPVWYENTTAEYYSTIISVAESPVERGVLWVGTDDGNLQLSRDGGKTWTNVARNVPGLGPDALVTHVEPSRTAAGTAYATFDRHMFDDFRPYVYRTTDFGRTWTRASGNLPRGAYLHVLREDPRNPRLVYAGTELGLFGSYDGGRRWSRLHFGSLPPVAVHEILVHPRENDLIVATHGRGVWVLDDATPVQRMADSVRAAPAHLFGVRPAVRFAMKPTRYGLGQKEFMAPNPPYGALVTYHLREKLDSAAPLKLEILDRSGAVVREVKKLPRERGLNRVGWDLAYDPPRPRRDSTPAGDDDDDFFGVARGPRALPGAYTARLTLGPDRYESPIEVRGDPAVTVAAADLQRQFDMALRLRDMQSSMNDVLRALDGVRGQLEERKKTATAFQRDSAAPLVRALDSAVARVDTLLGRLAKPAGKAYWSEAPRVSERLGALLGNVDRGNLAPTAAQVAHFDELRGEFDRALAAANQYLTTAVAEINATLSRYRGAALAVPVSPTAAKPGRENEKQ
jgi:hypothetical protein